MSFKGLSVIFLMVCLLTVVGCKSRFEQIRQGKDVSAKYKEALRLYNKKDYGSALILLEDLNTQYRGRAEAEDVLYYYAYASYHNGDYLTARELFKKFYDSYPESVKSEEVLYMAAYCLFVESPAYTLDQHYTIKAIESFQLFVNVFPTSARVKEAEANIAAMRQKLEKKAFLLAKMYYEMGEYRAAVVAFKTCLRDFPDTHYAEEIEYLSIESMFLLAKNSFEHKQEERYGELKSLCAEFKDKYAESKFLVKVNEAEKGAKTYFEQKNSLSHLQLNTNTK